MIENIKHRCVRCGGTTLVCSLAGYSTQLKRCPDCDEEGMVHCEVTASYGCTNESSKASCRASTLFRIGERLNKLEGR